MILTQVLLALTFVSAQANPQTDLHFPEIPQESPGLSKLAEWHGWAYLQGAQVTWPRLYETPGDWSAIKSHYTSVKQTASANWRLKVVIFTRIESDGRDVRGVLRERRATIESTQLTQIRESIDRFQAYMTAKYDGAVHVIPDIQIESEWMRDSGTTPYGPKFAKKYFEPRINGGSYEAEDKIFRGPYNSAIYVLPGACPAAVPDTTVNDTPVAGISANALDSSGIALNFDANLRQTFFRQVLARAKEHGYSSISDTGSPEGAAVAWSVACDLGESTPEKYLANLSKPLELHPAVADPIDIKSSISGPTDVQLVSDQERGIVLKILEASGQRDGGLVLPAKADGMPITKLVPNTTLTISVRSACKDPLAIRAESSNGKTAWISLGADPLLVNPMPGATVFSVPFLANGKWQKVSVDLHALAQQAGLVDIVRFALEPSPNARLNGKLQPEPVEYFFDEFKISADPAGPFLSLPVADAASEEPEARALFAAQAKAPSAELANLLKDKSELVRLNATTAYIPFKDVSVEPALIANSVDLDPSVASAALAALMSEGSDVARAIVLRSVSVSLSDYNKMTAAKLLADTKSPKVADDVSRLLASRSWQAHVSAVESLAEIPTPESQIWRLAFLGMSDPAVKLAVTRTADPNLDKVVSALLWSAVNEPSDCVRAESYIKLIQSYAEANKAEGYKGVRDDSEFVRQVVVKYLADHPSEEHRNALRVAIADKSAKVRAAALLGFAALEKGATTDEIANIIDDLNPDVQLALIDLSKKRSLKLPQKTLNEMASCPDPRVSIAVKTLGQ